MTHKTIFQGIRAHVSGSYRTESLHGKEYIVVPVVALVEGVLTGMSAAGPELALADEFAKFPDAWNGRPVVMSHPTNDDGMPVSANSPKVLENYQIGFLFNSSRDENKLIQEAWIDKSLTASLNDNAKEVLEALEAGEMIEVSTGYYAELEPLPGLYANQKYDAVQRSITPDHLAFLPIGTFGACSNKDGCGAKLAANSSKDTKFIPVKDFRVDAPCCAECAETGGNCQDDNKDPAMPHDNKAMDGKEKDEKDKKGRKKGDPKAYEALTIANTIADGVTLDNARTVVCSALKESGYGTYTYVVAMTTDTVVYEHYDNFRGEYVLYSRSYSVSADGAVTFGDDMQEVRLMTKIVAANSETDGNETTGTGDGNMPNDAVKPGETAPAPQANEKKEPVKVTNDQGTLEISFNEKGEPAGFAFTPKVNAAPKPQTAQEFIAQAPKEFQEVLSSSLKMHEETKTAIVDQLLATNRCKFSKETLAAMSLGDLQNLLELANVPSFEGRALPKSNSSQQEENYTPAPMVFEAPKAA
jgi:hypothetical protein